MTSTLCLQLLLLFTPCLSSLHLLQDAADGGELGDLSISDTSRDGLFASLDNDGNGKVTLEELTQFIEGTGGNSLDEQNEIESAVSNTMSQLDDNKDNVLKIDDLSKYWSSLGSVLSVEEVSDWVAHSQLMPDSVVQSFIENAITGYDFPELLENDGILLETELGVTRQTIKKRLMRGMKMKLFGMGTPPPASLSPAVRLSEQTLCYTNLQLEWKSMMEHEEGLSHHRASDVYPVHLYRLQRQEQSLPADRLVPLTSSSLSSPLSAGMKWVTVYEGTDTTCFDQIFTPPLRSSDENASGMLGQPITLTYRLSSWNVIGRSDYSHLRYEITRPTVSSWSELSGRDECLDQQTQPYLPSGALGLIAVNTLTAADLSSPAQSSSQRQNASPQILQTQQTETETEIPPPSSAWSLSSLFSAFFSFLWLVWTIYSTCRAWLWTALSILSLPLTVIYLYLRFNPPGVDSSSTHWLQSPALKSLVTASCLALVRISHSFSEQFPSTKSRVEPLIHLLETIANRETLNPAPRAPVPLTPSTLRQHRILKRMNSGRSLGDESADSQHSGEENKGCSDCEKCYLCFRPFKLQVTFPKIKWRVKHHCCVCLNLFCSKCGVVTHANVQCPVRGNCCCQRCSEALQQHKESHRSGESPPPSSHHHCDETSSVVTSADSVDGDHQTEKKKHRSFASLKDFGINLGKKPALNSEKASRAVFGDSTAPSGMPPRPSPSSSSSASTSQTTKKHNWPSIPTLGRRVTSSPPSINLDRSPCASPPEISSSVSWPLAGEHSNFPEEYYERLSS